MQLSLIIPAHNEAERLPATLDHYGLMLQRHFSKDFEVIVVANDCTDATVQIVTAYKVSRPWLRLHDIGGTSGKGSAVLEGFRQAHGQYLVFADADGATAPESLLALVNALDRHDIAIGSRQLPTRYGIGCQVPWLE